MTRSKKDTLITSVYFALAAIILAGLFARCRYGFPSDEAFYLLVPYRFMQGDIPILQEWHPTQISDIWIHPLVAAFLKISGSTEGIILAFRYIFTVVWGAFAVFIFMRLRKITAAGAAIASLSLLIYVPYGEMALYYNTIGIMTLTSACVILLTAEKAKKLQYIIAGFLLAMAITCCPFLIILYLTALVYCIIKKTLKSTFLYLTAGAGIAFLIFCIYFLSRSSLSAVLSSLHFLIDDREHNISMLTKLVNFAGNLLFPTITAFICFFAFAICCVIIKFNGKTTIGFAITIILAIIIQISLIIENGFINSFMLAPSLIGIYTFIFSKNEKIRNIFKMVFVPGLIYSFCINMSSNLGFSAIASAASVMSFASLLCGFIFSEEAGITSRIPVIAFAVLSVFQIGLQLDRRMNTVFDKAKIGSMTETLEYGCVKGIITTPGRINYYSWMSYDTLPLKADDIDSVLILSPETWMYLDVGKKISAHSCWLSGDIVDEYTIELLDEYYDLYPEKKPDVIYVESYYKNLVPLLEERGYTGNITELENYILYPDQANHSANLS